MGQHAGPILIQLSAMLTFNPEKVRYFFEYLRIHHPIFHFSLEARHVSWMEQAALELLEKFRIGWVIADSGMCFASANAVTARHIYLRFHGPDGSYSSGYSKKALTGIAESCQRWREAGHTIWVFSTMIYMGMRSGMRWR